MAKANPSLPQSLPTSDSTLAPTELVALESVIDRHGIENVLMAISEICGGKAEHIESNWQDRTLAKAWLTLEGAVGCIVPKARGL
jgi:hypothetical protein